jgi:hypothetical protein
VERADRDAELPVERGRDDPASLVERDRDGHAGCAQGRDARSQGAGDDRSRSGDASRELVKTARGYFETVQGKQRKYQPLLRPEDQPAVWLNKESMERFRPELRKHYYDASRFASYLEQLKVAYPPPMPASPPAAR